MFYDTENAFEFNYSCINCHNESFYNLNYTHPDELICIFHTDEDITSGIFKVFVYVMYIAVFVTALVGNGLVCSVVHKTPRMKTVTNYFIVNLAVGDILMTLFCVPFSFVSMLLLRYWPFGAFMCKAVNFSQAVSVLVSAYTLLAISIDRYIIIMHPLKPRLGKTAAKLVVFTVWSGAFITAAPIPIVSTLQRPSLWHRACEVDICGEQWSSPEKSRQYTYALLVLQFVLPLSALVCTYARIAKTVWGGRPPGEAQDARDTRMQHSKRKMIKMMLTVVTVFTMSWLPLNIFIVLWTVHEDDEEWSMWPGMPYMWFACHWLAMSHSCYNPMIYCYMNVRYRRGFKEILGGLLCLNKKDSSRPYQRSSICEGIPLSGLTIKKAPRSRSKARGPKLQPATPSILQQGHEAHKTGGRQRHRDNTTPWPLRMQMPDVQECWSLQRQQEFDLHILRVETTPSIFRPLLDSASQGRLSALTILLRTKNFGYIENRESIDLSSRTNNSVAI